MSTNAKIVAILVALPGKTQELEALLFSLAESSRAEPGNLRWDVWRDPADPTRFVLDELYADKDAVAAHLETPHFKDYLSKIGELAERTAYILEPAKVG